MPGTTSASNDTFSTGPDNVGGTLYHQLMNRPINALVWITLLTAPVSAKKLNANPRPQTPDIAPDCSERKTSIDEIKSIATNPKTKTMLDFLKALPKKSLQTFTFVKETSSSQHHLVSDLWPRVLRMSADGKIVMSFVCNKASQDYGSVEVLYFEDPPLARWRSLSLEFEKNDPDFKGLTTRALTQSTKAVVHPDSKTCLNCHGVGHDQSLRPIFPAYPMWPGFYGSEDDALFKGEREHTRYQQFKKLAATEPCFQTLPWPKNKVDGYGNYPYNSLERFTYETEPGQRERYLRKLKTNNYHLRANLKFTDALSHLNSQRIAYKFLRSNVYQSLAPLLAIEALACEKADLTSSVQKILGDKYQAPKYAPNAELNDPRSPDSRTLHLYTVGLNIGITPNEWTLHFNKPLDPDYATGIHGVRGYDTSTAQIVQGLLFNELAKTVPELKGKYTLTRGVSEFFSTQNFACIDDLGGALEFTDENRKSMCQTLSKELHNKQLNLKNLHDSKLTNVDANTVTTKNSASGSQSANELSVTVPASTLSTILQKLPTLKLAPNSDGGAIARTYCLACHGSESFLPDVYKFLITEEAFKKSISADPMLLHRALAYTENGRMPIGYTLDKSQKAALQNYFIKLAEGATK